MKLLVCFGFESSRDLLLFNAKCYSPRCAPHSQRNWFLNKMQEFFQFASESVAGREVGG